jgi:hypothetical protein
MSKSQEAIAVEELLNTLPENPDDIAALLIKEGCRIVCDEYTCRTCPIANYIHRQLFIVVDIINVVGTFAVDGKYSGRLAFTPPKITKFIQMVDRGQYPELTGEATLV